VSTKPEQDPTLRQGAARRPWKLCTARPLAAACRSLLRYSAGSRSAPPHAVWRLPTPRPSLARRSVGSSGPRPDVSPRTAVGCRPQDVQAHSGTPRPGRATPTLCIAANAAGWTLSARPGESGGRRTTPPQAHSGLCRYRLRASERCALGARKEPRHNEAVDSDAQLRTLPAVAPVGRRSPLRYSGDSRSAPPHAIWRLPTLLPSLASRSVGSSGPRPDLSPRTAAGCRPQDVRAHSGTPGPGRATPTLCIAANAAGLTLSARPGESGGRRTTPPQAHSGLCRHRLRASERRAQGVREEPRHNEAVDSDAQLRTLPAVAPVGRRSPLRYSGGSRPAPPHAVWHLPSLRPLLARRSVGSSGPHPDLSPRTAAGCRPQDVAAHSGTPRPGRATPTLCIAANAAGLTPSTRPGESGGRRTTPSRAHSGLCRYRLRVSERCAQGVREEPRHNEAVDTDAQLRTLPAVAPVGRRSPLRYSGGSRSVPPHAIWPLPTLRPSLASRSVGSSGPRPDVSSRTAAGCRPQDVRAHSGTPRPGRAAPTLCIAANAAGLTLSARPSGSGGRRTTPPQAHSGLCRYRLRASERCALGARKEPRHNEAVDSDAQLRTLPAVAPVGRRSPLRYSGDSRSAPPHAIWRLPTLLPSLASRSVGSSGPRPDLSPRTAAGCRPQDVRAHSGTPGPGRATPTLCIAANAAGLTLSARPGESGGRRTTPPQAHSGLCRHRLRASERRAQGVREEPRHNEAVDSDAQLRTLPAVAPVGRRSPLRYSGGSRPAPPHAVWHLPSLRPLLARRSVGSSGPHPDLSPRTAAGCRPQDVAAHSGTPRPGRATPTLCIAANAAGLTPSTRPGESGGRRTTPSRAHSGLCRYRLRVSERCAQGVREEPRHNEAVDTDAQLRTLPAVAPVGRRSPLRYSGGSRSVPPHAIWPLPTLRPSLASRSVGSSGPRPDVSSRTAAGCRPQDVRAHSGTPRPGRAAPTLCIAANAAGLTLSARPSGSGGRRTTPPQAHSGLCRYRLRASERCALGVRQEPRHNEAVDTDAQLRTLPAVAPVGRRSPLRYMARRVFA